MMTPEGKIEVICGSMFSGKTEELMRRLRRAVFAKQKIQVFKPQIDNRYSEDHVQSHDANKIPSHSIENANQILVYLDDKTRVVGIDEAQFFGDEIVDIIEKLAFRGVRVIVAGLDTDFQSRPFGPMPQLLAIAEEVSKLSAVCVVCGKAACRTQRLNNSDEQVLVGASVEYEPRCRFCHEPQGINNDQISFQMKWSPAHDA